MLKCYSGAQVHELVFKELVRTELLGNELQSTDCRLLTHMESHLSEVQNFRQFHLSSPSV